MFINQFNEKKKKKIYEKQQNHNYVSLKKPKLNSKGKRKKSANVNTKKK